MGSDILNVIDQWCTIFSLKPLDIWIAGGERGCCPNDMLNDIPGWIMRSVQGKKLPASSMTHVQCLLCFGILMRQRFSFDWFRLCFLSAFNPLQKLHVLRLYRKGPDMKPPPIVLQMDIDHYIVALKKPFCMYYAARTEQRLPHRRCMVRNDKEIQKQPFFKKEKHT
jgi:hypothetical protein